MPRTRGARGRHRSARKSVITTEAAVAAIVCCLLGLLQQHQAACQLAATSSNNDNNRITQLKPSYVFPTSQQQQQQQRPLQVTSGQQLPQQQQRQHAIYINPNPSTLSAGFHQQMQQKHRLAAASGPQGNNQKKRAAIASHAMGAGGSGGQLQANSMVPNEAAVASAVGHQILSQVAEWPFYKSLQTARKTNAARYQQHNGQLSGDSSSSQKLARQQQLAITTPPPQQPSSAEFGNELVRRPVAESTTTTTTTAPTTTTAQTTTTTQTSATSAPNGEPSPQDQADSDLTLSTVPKSNERDSALSASTTTTMAPNPIMDSSQAASATEQPTTPSTTTMAPSASVGGQDPLFAPNFHTSIQQAINRIVKMTAESSAKAADSSDDNRRSTPAATAAVTARPASDLGGPSNAGSGDHSSLRSSLSLNVLLKNFGVHNLTNLDQILLKSTLRNDTSNRAHQRANEIDSSPNDQKIEIIGLRNLQQPKVISSEGSENDDQMAECKIEYTMKHVNISLMNGGKADYTCDYIIDRKMTADSVGGGTGGVAAPIRATKLDIRKVCKLQLTSKFFADKLEESKTIGSEPADCNGTYLAVGLLRFCYLSPQKLASGGAEERTLNRVFDFPIERDMFDIKMVHKKPTARSKDQARQVSDDSGSEASEIHLEIRPLADKDCASAQTARPPSAAGNDNDDQSSTSSPFEPEGPSAPASMQMKPREQPAHSMMLNAHGRPADSVGVERELASSAGSTSTSTSMSITTSTTTTTSSPSASDDADRTSEDAPSAAEEGSNDSSSSSSAGREPRNRADRGGQNTNSRQRAAPAAASSDANDQQNSGSQPESRDAHRAKPTGPPKRKIVLQVPLDKQLHPLNNRFKVSQSFDVSSAPRHYQPGGAANFPLATAPGAKDADDSSHKRNLVVGAGKLCDGFEHISTVGQLLSPDYPRYYPAHVNCSFVVRQAASNFCQLLLHFRDFDLINPEQSQQQQQASQAQQQHCPNDYLQIGDTRYCNRYAMIGHKMRLDFPLDQPVGAAISMSFRSDHMRSGRGFLIKYQQVPCASDADSTSPSAASDGSPGRAPPGGARESKQRQSITTTQIGDLMPGGPRSGEHGHTLAPPLQQPDFSLALKTISPSRSDPRIPKNEPNNNGATEPKAGQKSPGANNQQPQQETRAKEPAAAAHSSGNLSQVKFNEKIMGSTTASDKRRRQDAIVSNSTTSPTTAQQLLTMASTVSSPSLALFGQQQQQQLQDESFQPAPTGPQCNQMSSEQSFLLRSFSYPDNYASNLQCLYYVRRNSSQVCYLELTFIKFDLEADADCRYDYLEINNIRLCGSLKDLPHKTTRIYFFNEPIKLIKFRSDDSGSKQGFLIRVDQLECGSSGSILRQSKTLSDEHFRDDGQKSLAAPEQQPEQRRQHQSAEPGGVLNFNNNNSDQDLSSSPKSSPAHRPTTATATGAGEQMIWQRSNSSRTFEYDSTSTLAGDAWRGQHRSDSAASPQTSAQPSSASGGDEKALIGSSLACGGLFEGNEITIKSPLWPESYANDESLGTCRYTIVRNQAAKNKICQLELRFVSLRLDVSDCIDVDGYEVLCGFNTRNMVKYYPFDRQTHLTITFFAGVGKFARSLGGQQESRQPKSDLLPSRAPFRFMIRAKQHECIDGFLAPQSTDSSGQDAIQSIGGGGGGYNHTNLLYSGQGELRYANKTSLDLAPNVSSQQSSPPSSSNTSSLARRKLSLAPAAASGKNDSLLSYDFSNLAPSSAPAANKRSSSSAPTLMYSLAGHLNGATDSNLSSSLPPTSSSPVGLFSGCLDGAITRTSDQLFSANYPLKYGPNLHCALTVSRESVAFCHLELEFLDMDLDSQTKFCESDYFQINYAERYCTMEQVETRLGPRRLNLVPFELAHNNRITLVFHSDQFNSRRGFLIRHRQVPCSSDVRLVPAATPPLVDGGRHRHHDRVSNPESRLIERVPLLGQPKQQSAPDLSSSVANFDQSQTTGADKERCLIQFSHYNGILSSSSISSKLRTNFAFRNECEVRLKLMPGFCQVQLTFGEFELTPRLGNDYCLELLELNGVQYCGDELKNASRLLSISDLSQRAVQIRYVGSNSSYFNGFRAVFKQIECQPEPLKPVLIAPDSNVGGRQQADASSKWPPGRQAPRQQPGAGGGNSSGAGQQQQQVEFKEIAIRSEFFELNSLKLSKSTSGYDPNMFVVYRLKKVSPDVCRLRLMFYKFDLEASLGCKRDFLDVNNVDRLCGQLGKPEETRRDYDWLNERDFLISFVSDVSLEREGFLLFGQQLHSANCSNSQQQQQLVHQPTFDEAPDQAKTTSATTVMTPEAPPPPPPPPTNVKIGHHQAQASQHDQDGGATRAAAHEHQPDSSPKEPGGAGSDNCYRLFYESKFDFSSPNWPQKYGPKTTCYYLIHKSQQDSANCSSFVTLNVVSLILGPEEMAGDGESPAAEPCDTSAHDYLDIDGRILCGLISRPRAITVDFGPRQFITVKFGSHSASGFGFFIEARQHSKCPSASAPDRSETDLASPRPQARPSDGGDEQRQPARGGPRRVQGAVGTETPAEAAKQAHAPTPSSSCQQLLTSEVSLIESEHFPRHYPHNQDCLYALRRTNQTICAIDLIMSHFELEEQSAASGTCDSDYLEIDYSRLCGSYPPKHRLRFNYFGDELDKYVKFHSDASVSRSGFSLTVRQVTNCAGAPLASQPKGGSQADNDEVINYLPDTSTASNLPSPTAGSGGSKPHAPKAPVAIAASADNHSDAAGDDELSLAAMKEFSTLCQFVYHRERQYLVSPNYNEHRRSYDNNIDCLYKIVAKGYEFCSLKLTVLDLDLELSSECQHDYLLIDSQRYCSQAPSSGGGGNSSKTARPANESSALEVLEIPFAETLPREIHLLYHTNAHINEGRGFKLFYEQQPCRVDDTTAGEASGNRAPASMRNRPASSDPEERQARRMRLGQLSYPQNYVSSQSTASSAGRVQAGQSKRAQQQSLAPSSSRGSSSFQKPQQPSHQGAQADDLDQQHDDLTLRKEIVVAKSAPLIMVH